MKLTGACKWGASALLMAAPLACAVGTEYTEGELGSEGEIATVEQQIVTQTEKNRIEAKWETKKSWLGAPYDPNSATAYWESSNGVGRQYAGGAVLYSRSKSTAYVADWDAYFGWSWIGGGYFGYPTEDQRAMVSNSAQKVLPFSGGFIVTKPSTHDNWPVMKVVNTSYKNGNARIICSFPNATSDLAVDCSGSGFPPNTSVKVGYGGRSGLAFARTVSTNSTGSFSAQLRPGPGNKVDAYNNIITLFARATTGIATYQSLDASGSPFIYPTQNMY